MILLYLKKDKKSENIPPIYAGALRCHRCAAGSDLDFSLFLTQICCIAPEDLEYTAQVMWTTFTVV